ncbi:hypothetical protein HZC30_00705 [Candidatus Woesearchaeota archaeon]|nr:hypothetical protein [Candidatus Woesearchaeota archaeon]
MTCATDLIGPVVGVHPVSGETKVSEMYSRITPETIDDIFQTDLSHKFGEQVRGGKAVVYADYYGRYHVAFLTEAVYTHHRHAAATLVGLDDPRAKALYEGDYDQVHDLLDRIGGFELQLDAQTRQIIGIQQDSWITKRQRDRGRVISSTMQEEMVLELLSSIDPSLLSERYRELECIDDQELFVPSIPLQAYQTHPLN